MHTSALFSFSFQLSSIAAFSSPLFLKLSHFLCLFSRPPVPLFPPFVFFLTLITAQYLLTLHFPLSLSFFSESICSHWLCFTLFLCYFPLCSSFSAISCTVQPCCLISLYSHTLAPLFCCYFFFRLSLLPFSFLSQWGNLENFISPFFSVRQETTSIFLWKRQRLWLTQAHSLTHTRNTLSIHVSHPTQHILFSLQMLPKSARYL